ncbi:ABC transporter ATP-binding protein [Demequina sp. NBRC 110057]|uniref:ABC transporter ATP-binding protein n=1 Tax=Demequina sp. NBRC 110057 TaxID=1570346 RepID=UPI0009FC2E62|nr:ABC transporter ATP-binding protein [Demequina sp. NBRC 110057]
MTTTAPAALDVQHLSIRYGTGTPVVSDVTLSVAPGEIVGIIGESGCGKSSIGFALMGLLPGTAVVEADALGVGGRDMADADERDWNGVRGTTASMIFQEPMSALNPCMRIGAQIAEVLTVHSLASKKEALAKAVELLTLVQVPEPELRAQQFPHQLSGGMRQRVVIAMAMAADPTLLIADEPTTALDVTVQAQILDLLDKARRETGAGVLLISHDLGVIAQTCDRVVVMYAGQIVEEGTPSEVLARPSHPYTAALVDSIPTTHTAPRVDLPMIRGGVTDADRATAGCRFAARCAFATDGCSAPQELEAVEEGHTARCWRTHELPLSRKEVLA